ncbi:hypothetical protein [Aeromicrobium sp. REDSEA-S38_B2]|uniref:hypothetical protein n=1 Tax=Aeromicrobium sp. REDSEA-S38_B2 TaxID=1811528 RepID=UPI000B0D45D8|nr:hypothetical protein [Aeromicrobium sp. REDSEA-S38_B2]
METSSVPYDDQTPEQQAVTRAQWNTEIARTRASLNYEELFAARGEVYSEATPDGRLLRHPAAPPEEADKTR